jgi:glyoxylase-like metal-dependent hydrolase (beta-lactamase superfamily II)
MTAAASRQIISRRSFLKTTSLAAAAIYSVPTELIAQQSKDFAANARAAAANNKITTVHLRHNMSVLLGGGGNIAVLQAKEGKLVVDTGYLSCQPQVAAALTAINNQPVRILVNTHWHLDHTDGNERFHNEGATIWAHENTRYRMSTKQYIELFDATFPPSPPAALPTMLVNEYREIPGSGNTVKMTHYAPAHTDSDLAVYFAEADVLHCGDTWFNGMYPFLDPSTGGNINGMITATEYNLAHSTDQTIIIPGHGPVGNRAQLAETHQMLTAVRDNVAALKKQGKSLNEAIAAKPNAALDEKWGTGFVKPELMVTLAYMGV